MVLLSDKRVVIRFSVTDGESGLEMFGDPNYDLRASNLSLVRLELPRIFYCGSN